MKLSEYFAQAGRGSRTRLASAIGASKPNVSDWSLGHRPVPVKHAAAIERATAGAVTRRDLRPGDWHEIWPELADAQDQPACEEPANV